MCYKASDQIKVAVITRNMLYEEPWSVNPETWCCDYICMTKVRKIYSFRYTITLYITITLCIPRQQVYIVSEVLVVRYTLFIVISET